LPVFLRKAGGSRQGQTEDRNKQGSPHLPVPEVFSLG
jgi:hypothetical protein